MKTTGRDRDRSTYRPAVYQFMLLIEGANAQFLQKQTNKQKKKDLLTRDLLYLGWVPSQTLPELCTISRQLSLRDPVVI